jgi:uncharacterized membrane protein YccC
VDGWGKVLAGVVIGVAGAVYATNEDLRKRLPKSARDLPDNVRRRFDSAVSAAREASSRRREEILRDLQEHDASHAGRGTQVEIKQEPGAAGPTADEVGPSPRAGD